MIKLTPCLQERPKQLSDGRNLRHDRADGPEVTPMNQDEKEKGTFCGGGGGSSGEIKELNFGHVK